MFVWHKQASSMRSHRSIRQHHPRPTLGWCQHPPDRHQRRTRHRSLRVRRASPGRGARCRSGGHAGPRAGAPERAAAATGRPGGSGRRPRGHRHHRGDRAEPARRRRTLHPLGPAARPRGERRQRHPDHRAARGRGLSAAGWAAGGWAGPSIRRPGRPAGARHSLGGGRGRRVGGGRGRRDRADLRQAGRSVALHAGFRQPARYFITDLDIMRSLLMSVLLAAVATTGAALATRRTTVGWMAVVALGALLPLALAGHAAGSADHEAAVDSLAFHLVAVTVWAGGLAALAMLPDRRWAGDGRGRAAATPRSRSCASCWSPARAWSTPGCASADRHGSTRRTARSCWPRSPRCSCSVLPARPPPGPAARLERRRRRAGLLAPGRWRARRHGNRDRARGGALGQRPAGAAATARPTRPSRSRSPGTRCPPRRRPCRGSRPGGPTCCG